MTDEQRKRLARRAADAICLSTAQMLRALAKSMIAGRDFDASTVASVISDELANKLELLLSTIFTSC